MSFSKFVTNKLFASSSFMGGGGVKEVSSPAPLPYTIGRLKQNPTANRCLNMIIDSAAAVPYKIKEGAEKITSSRKVQPQTILSLINRKANPQMDANFFWRMIIGDLLAHGNAFILVRDGYHYYLPAEKVTVVGDNRKLVDHYEMETIKFQPDEIIQIKDNSGKMIRGESRFVSMAEILDLHKKMKDFQRNFFHNNAMPGVILESPNTLTDKLKKRKIEEWKQEFNPMSGARSPAFLDGGITVKNLDTATFREMDFENSIQSLEKDIARTMGVPPILLEGGNNANIAPNLRLFYIETVIPITEKIAAAISLYYGYETVPDEVKVKALQPDLRELGNYVSSIVNTGIATKNEGREMIGLPKSTDPDADTLITPANIAGSAANPSTGGRPKDPAEGEE